MSSAILPSALLLRSAPFVHVNPLFSCVVSFSAPCQTRGFVDASCFTDFWSHIRHHIYLHLDRYFWSHMGHHINLHLDRFAFAHWVICSTMLWMYRYLGVVGLVRGQGRVDPRVILGDWFKILNDFYFEIRRCGSILALFVGFGLSGGRSFLVL